MDGSNKHRTSVQKCKGFWRYQCLLAAASAWVSAPEGRRWRRRLVSTLNVHQTQQKKIKKKKKRLTCSSSVVCLKRWAVWACVVDACVQHRSSRADAPANTSQIDAPLLFINVTVVAAFQCEKNRQRVSLQDGLQMPQTHPLSVYSLCIVLRVPAHGSILFQSNSKRQWE